MRLIVATRDGARTLRWIEGERSAQRVTEGLVGEPITALATARGAVWCATGSGGLYRSDDRGEGWRRVFRDREGRALTAVAVRDEEGDELVVGTEPAAVHRSTDGGESWEELESFRRLGEEEEWRGYGNREPHVQTLALDPDEPRRIYVGVELGGAYRTDDAGASWSAAAHGLYEDLHVLAVEPREGSRTYAATGGGFYVSRNRGRDWTEASPDPAGGVYCTALLLDGPAAAPDRSALLLTTASAAPGSWSEREEGAGSRLHRSEDAGGSWREIELWGPLASRSGLTALAPSPMGSEGFFVGTSAGEIHYALGRGEGWIDVFQERLPIRRIAAI